MKGRRSRIRFAAFLFLVGVILSLAGGCCALGFKPLVHRQDASVAALDKVATIGEARHDTGDRLVPRANEAEARSGHEAFYVAFFGLV